jgi:hypothetical protein
MRERNLRRRCKRLLNDLDIEPPLDVEALCERLGERRGRPIQLIAHPLPVPGPFGVWIAGQSADYVFYQRATTSSHQNHIILHELGHMIAEHVSDGDAEPDGLAVDTYPDLDTAAVRRALQRSSYDSAHEQEAELVATIIAEWASVLDRVAPRRSPGAAARRMGPAMGDRMGWL